MTTGITITKCVHKLKAEKHDCGHLINGIYQYFNVSNEVKRGGTSNSTSIMYTSIIVYND